MSDSFITYLKKGLQTIQTHRFVLIGYVVLGLTYHSILLAMFFSSTIYASGMETFPDPSTQGIGGVIPFVLVAISSFYLIVQPAYQLSMPYLILYQDTHKSISSHIVVATIIRTIRRFIFQYVLFIIGMYIIGAVMVITILDLMGIATLPETWEIIAQSDGFILLIGFGESITISAFIFVAIIFSLKQTSFFVAIRQAISVIGKYYGYTTWIVAIMLGQFLVLDYGLTHVLESSDMLRAKTVMIVTIPFAMIRIMIIHTLYFVLTSTTLRWYNDTVEKLSLPDTTTHSLTHSDSATSSHKTKK